MKRIGRKLTPRKSHKVGLAPGSLVPVGLPETGRVRVTAMDYDRDHLEEREFDSVEDCVPFRDSSSVTWLDVTGLSDMELVRGLGDGFGLHPLVLEDLVNTEQRPKLDDYGEYIFVVVKMLTFREEAEQVEEEQVAVVLGRNFVISFQERAGDVFDPVRERIRGGRGRIRHQGPDYLAYALIDALVDHYFVVLEKLGDWVERVELELMEDPTEDTAREIHQLKRELLLLRKAIWPLREVMNAFQREGTSLITQPVRVFARDAYDHTVQVIDTAETLRDLVGGMLDTYLTSISNRMNEVMKVLTIIATIFIPLTFIAGIYGMNFENMPELSWPWAYPAVWGVMVAVAAVMALFFRSRDWL